MSQLHIALASLHRDINVGGGRVGDMAHAKRTAIAQAPRSDDFWTVEHVQPCRGMSSVTYAYHDVAGTRVYHQYYTPGPFDLLAYGAESIQATPKSTYYVWTALAFGMPDEYPLTSHWDNPEDWSEEKLIGVVTKAVGKIPNGAVVDIWSPDGEGAIYLKFKDEGVEDALAFAMRMSELTAKHDQPRPTEEPGKNAHAV